MKMRHLVPLLVVLCPLVSMAATPGTAKGTITFNGKPKNLTYAYAWKEEDHFTNLTCRWNGRPPKAVDTTQFHCVTCSG